MLFLSKYTIRPEHKDAAVKRFLETAASPPEGVKMIGRWHDVGSRSGYSVVEADDAVVMAKFSNQWNDLLTIETHVVLTDEQFGQVVSGS
jgi:hypothetical protein